MDDLKKSVMDLWNKSTSTSGSSGKFKGQGHRLGGGEGPSAAAAGAGRGASGYSAGRGANPPSSGGRLGAGSSGTTRAGPTTAGAAAAARPVALGRSGAAAERMLHDQHVMQQQQQEKQMEERRKALKDQQQAGTAAVRPADGSFDPFSPHFTSGAAASSYASVKRQEVQDQQRQQQQQEPASVAQCPVCMRFSGTEQEVSAHVDVCLSLGMDPGGPLTLSNDGPSSLSTPPAASSAAPQVAPSTDVTIQAPGREVAFSDAPISEQPADVDRSVAQATSTPSEPSERHWAGSSAAEEIHHAAGVLLSADPPPATLEILRKLLSNVLAEPGNEKFRRVRMSNPKIAQSVGAAPGAVEMLLAVGFAMKEDGGDTWALLEDAASDQTQAALQEALSLIPPPAASPLPAQPSAPTVQSGAAAAPEPAAKAPVKFDRKVRVFLSTSENSASRIEVPDSFYDRSAEDVRQEAMARRKALESSQVLMTRASREKQKEALKRKYKLCVIRVLLPDGLVLQGLFRPWELTSSVYEFVAGSLRDPTQEFQLMHSVPMAGRSNLIPSVAAPSAPIPSLEKEQLVPASLIKFKPFCLGPPGYTGLARDLLERVEPLTAVPLPSAEP